MVETSLILVNYRTEAHLLATLRHILSLPEENLDQIIVVDNSPSGGLADSIQSLSAQIEYFPSSVNLGFAGGVNSGLRRARGEVIILLNPDARPEPGCLSGLVAALGARPEAAVAGPKLLPFESDRPLLPSATLRDPDLLTALIEYTPCRSLFKRNWLWHNYFLDPATTRRVTVCSMVQGACFAIKRYWIQRVGLFDAERFFLYFEETDFCRRIRLQRGTILYCPQLVCRHLGGASLGGRSQDVVRFWESFYAYHAKHYGRRRSVFLKQLLTLGLMAEYVLCQLKRNCGLSGTDLEFIAYTELVGKRLDVHLGRNNNVR
jgi:GT2 family glycosyltransferase